MRPFFRSPTPVAQSLRLGTLLAAVSLTVLVGIGPKAHAQSTPTPTTAPTPQTANVTLSANWGAATDSLGDEVQAKLFCADSASLFGYSISEPVIAKKPHPFPLTFVPGMAPTVLPVEFLGSADCRLEIGQDFSRTEGLSVVVNGQPIPLAPSKTFGRGTVPFTLAGPTSIDITVTKLTKFLSGTSVYISAGSQEGEVYQMLKPTCDGVSAGSVSALTAGKDNTNFLAIKPGAICRITVTSSSVDLASRLVVFVNGASVPVTGLPGEVSLTVPLDRVNTTVAMQLRNATPVALRAPVAASAVGTVAGATVPAAKPASTEAGARIIRLTLNANVSGPVDTAPTMPVYLDCSNARIFGKRQNAGRFQITLLPASAPTVLDYEVTGKESCELVLDRDAELVKVNGQMVAEKRNVVLDMSGDTTVDIQYVNLATRAAPVPPAGYNILRSSLNFTTGDNGRYKVRFDGCTGLASPPQLDRDALDGTFRDSVGRGPELGRPGASCTMVATAEGIDLASRLVVLLNGAIVPVVDNGGGTQVSVVVPFESLTNLTTYLRPLTPEPFDGPPATTSASSSSSSKAKKTTKPKTKAKAASTPAKKSTGNGQVCVRVTSRGKKIISVSYKC
jgi:hypothetical protein